MRSDDGTYENTRTVCGCRRQLNKHNALARAFKLGSHDGEICLIWKHRRKNWSEHCCQKKGKQFRHVHRFKFSNWVTLKSTGTSPMPDPESLAGSTQWNVSYKLYNILFWQKMPQTQAFQHHHWAEFRFGNVRLIIILINVFLTLTTPKRDAEINAHNTQKWRKRNYKLDGEWREMRAMSCSVVLSVRSSVSFCK